MSKEDSKIMQGVAFLLMLFLHLFNHQHNVDLCHIVLFINDTPLIWLLTRAAHPVPFFLILSGYGLCYNYSHGKLSLNTLFPKVLKLYIYYWITLFLFVGLGSILQPEKYPGCFGQIVTNMLGWSSLYNGETWFLLPYVLICLTSKVINKVIDRLGIVLSVLLTCIGNLATGYLISRYGEVLLFDNQFIYMPVLYIQFLFPFTLGCALYKYSNRYGLYVKKHFCMLFPCLLLLLLLVRVSYHTGAFDSEYAFLFILLFINIRRLKCFDNILYAIGKKSMVMWLIHTWFCYYLFHDFIYSFKYPIVIYLVTLLCSYVSSYFITWIAEKVYSQVNFLFRRDI